MRHSMSLRVRREVLAATANRSQQAGKKQKRQRTLDKVDAATVIPVAGGTHAPENNSKLP